MFFIDAICMKNIHFFTFLYSILIFDFQFRLNKLLLPPLKIK
jgi:hypothetical protein